jgi:hypothetical protein
MSEQPPIEAMPDLSFLEQNIEPEPTTPDLEQTPQETQQNDAISQFVAILESGTYTTKEGKTLSWTNEKEARKAFAAIAKGLGCSKQLGYKAIKKVSKFQKDESNTAKEVTVKFEKGTELVFDKPADNPTYDGDDRGRVTKPAPVTPPPYVEPPPTVTGPQQQTPRMATLMPVFNHFSSCTVSEGFELLVGKVLGASEDDKPLFSEEEEAMLGVLVPENITKFTGSQLNDSNIVEGTDAVMGLTAAFRLIKRKQEAKAKRLIPPQQSTPPPQAPAPAPEQKQEPPHLADLPNPEPAFQKGQKPNYMKNL